MRVQGSAQRFWHAFISFETIFLMLEQYDIGTFKIVTPYGSKRDKNADTSDEDESDDDNAAPVYGGKKGLNQERALAKVYKGDNEKSSFSIELKGKRWVPTAVLASAISLTGRYHMRLSFSLDKTGKQTKVH